MLATRAIRHYFICMAKQPPRPKPQRPHGRTLADVSKGMDKNLMNAILENMRKGEKQINPDSTFDCHNPVKNPQTPQNTITAEFLRFLLLGGDDNNPIHERGVNIRGYYITGQLDLRGCEVKFNIGLVNCRFEKQPIFQDCKILGHLSLEYSHCANGFNGQGMLIAKNLFMRNGFQCHDECSLMGAEIGGQWNCTSGVFENKIGYSINADGIKVGSDVLFNEQFTSHGECDLLGAEIGGQWNCEGGKFANENGKSINADGIKVGRDVFFNGKFTSNGECRLLGAVIGGQWNCVGGTFANKSEIKKDNETNEIKYGDAIQAQKIIVKNGIFLNNIEYNGILDLFGAEIDTLQDDDTSWKHRIYDIEDCKIRTFAGDNIDRRLEMLENQVSKNYHSSYQNCMRVYERTGESDKYKQVAVALERRITKNTSFGIKKIVRWLFGGLSDYGHNLPKLFWIFIVIWLSTSFIYYFAAYYGLFAPSDSQTLYYQHITEANENKTENGENITILPESMSNLYMACKVNQDKENNWYTCKALPPEYATLSPIAYSLDLLLPFVDLGQDKYWGVKIDTPKPNGFEELFTNWTYNHGVRIVIWFEILFGWVLGAILLSVISAHFAKRVSND